MNSEYPDEKQRYAVCNSLWKKEKKSMAAKVERRFIPDTEIRVNETDEGVSLEGYAAVFNSWSEDLGGFKERVLPGAFKKTIKESDIRGLINHDPNLILGRTKAGTLKLEEDKTGLRYSTQLDMEISYVSDLVRSIKRGDISGNSFAFRTIKDSWETEDGQDTRDLHEVRLLDISPVVYPAYPATSLSLRSLPLEEGLDIEALNGLLFRLDHGRTLSDADLELLQRSIEFLQNQIPVTEEPEEPQPEEHSEDAGEEPTYHSLRARLRLRRKNLHRL